GRPYLEATEEELKKRRSGQVVRVEGEEGIGATLLEILSERVEVDASDVYRVKGPLDTRALWPLVDLPALEHLREPVLKPLPVLEPTEQTGTAIFGVLAARDVLLHHPYESFEPVCRLVGSAGPR